MSAGDTVRLLALFAASLTFLACGGESLPQGEARWVVERPWMAGPMAPNARSSAGNVSRPRWAAATFEVELAPEPGARVELELAPVEPGAGPGELTMSLERSGESLRIQASALGPERPGPRPWYRFRFPLEGVRDGAYRITFEADAEALETSAKWLVSAPRVLQRRSIDRRLNVLYVTIDTLRADHLGCYGHDRPTSPNIDALARSGVRFERAISQAPWTLPSYASLFTGRLPESHGVVHVEERFSDSLTSFVELFARSEYATGAVVSGTFTDSYWGFDQGFDSYDDLGMVVDDDAPPGGDPTDIQAMDRHAHKRVTSAEVTEKALRWLEEHRDQRFLLLAHYFDPHYDYVAHSGISELFPPRPAPGATEVRDVDRMHAAYEGEIAFTDRYVGALLSGLEALGLAGETIVVLQADHGEAFEEHGMAGHGGSLHNEELWVPLLMRVPGIAPRTVAEPVGVLDVGPTLLALCDLPGEGPSQGFSLAPLLRGDTLARTSPVSSSLYRSFAPGPARRGMQFQYRVEQDDACFLGDLRPKHRARWMFDWRADPAQLHDLAPQEVERSISIEERYLAARELWWLERPEPDSLTMRPETLDTLQGLGYAGNADDESPNGEDRDEHR